MANAILAELSADQYFSVFVGAMILVALVAVFYAAVTYIKRWVQQSDTQPGGGFTLSDLRALKKAGKMTSDEFDRAKALLIAAEHARTAKAAAKIEKKDGSPPDFQVKM